MKQEQQRIINIRATLSLFGVAVMAATGLVMWGHSFTSRPEPPKLEESIAMSVHDSSIPGRYEKMTNALSTGSVNLVEAGGHYEEHCAVCHGDTGNGKPKFHGLMYPRPSNLLSDDTMEMSDGELFFIIKQGIRYSGMPAFGKQGDDDEHAWKMVAYVRHLPKLTSAEVRQVVEQLEEPMDHSGVPQTQSHRG